MKKISFLTLCFVLIFAFCSCGNSERGTTGETTGGTAGGTNASTTAPGEEVTVVDEAVKLDINYSSESLGFSLNIISASEKTDVKFVRFEGTGLENIRDVEFKKRTFENSNYVEKDGNYLHAYHFKVNTTLHDIYAEGGKYSIKINSVVLNIGGKEQTVDFKYPIDFCRNKDYNDRDTHMYGPITIFGDSFDMEQRFSFSIMPPKEDIYIKNFYFSDFLDAKNATLFAEVENTSYGASGGTVSGVITQEIGKLNGTASYKIEAGQKSLIYCVPALKDIDGISKYDFITCMATLEYCIEGDDTVYKARFPINSQGIYSKKSAEAFISYVLDN